MHDRVLSAAQEIRRSNQSIQHARTHHARAVGVAIDIHLDRRVHPNDAETANNLGVIGRLLAAQEELVKVPRPVRVEGGEAVRGEADRRCGGKVEVAGVDEVEEGIFAVLRSRRACF